MPRRQKQVDYSKRADLLRKYGYKVKYGTRGHFKSSDKAAVSRVYEKIRQYIENPKQKFVWKKNPSSQEQKKSIREGLSSSSLTPDGYFLRVPSGAKRKPSLRSISKNLIIYEAEGKSGGRVIEEIHKIDWRMLMEDPPKAILALGKPGDRVILTVNGYDSAQTLEYELQALSYYLALDLLPKFLDPNLDPAYTRAHGKQKGTKREKLKRFTDIFHVKIIRHIAPPRKKKRKARKASKKNRRR